MGLFSGWVDKFKKGLQKTKEAFSSPIRKLLSVFRNLDESTLEVLEPRLIGADVRVEATTKIMESLRQAYKKGDIKTTDQVLDFLKADLRRRLTEHGNALNLAKSGPTVILIAGVNGVGKTTSIAKLASYLTKEKKKVILAASDTFRAAA